MALKKKSLKQIAKENTQVTVGTKQSQKVVKKAETPPDKSRTVHSEKGVVGASLGVTKNMDNYESLRVDCWLTDTVREGETEDKAFNRVFGVLNDVLEEVVGSFID